MTSHKDDHPKAAPAVKNNPNKTPLNAAGQRRRRNQAVRGAQLAKEARIANQKAQKNTAPPDLSKMSDALNHNPKGRASASGSARTSLSDNRNTYKTEENPTAALQASAGSSEKAKNSSFKDNAFSRFFTFKGKTTKQRIGIVLVSLLLLFVLSSAAVFAYALAITPTLDPDNFNFVTNSQILDKDGNKYQDFQASENREVVSIDKIPEHVQNAFIAIEDERFYSHGGVDLQGIARALLGIASSGSLEGPGGSTITQQLIKLTHLTSDKTITRKLQEIILANRLERIYTKQQILEAYLNKINLSQAWGVQAAAKTYFNKDVSQLDVAQGAMLAAMPKSPTYYDPYVYVTDASGNTTISVGSDGRYALNPKNQERAIIILDKMLELGDIDQSQHDSAQSEIENNNVGLTYVEREISYSYFTDSLYEQLLSDLEDKKGMSEDDASDYLLNGGLTIYSTVDQKVQTSMEEAAADDNLFPSQSSAAAQASAAKSADTGEAVNYVPQVGMTIIDNATGSVAGIVGGRDKKTNLSLNRATQPFQPGSSTKPLTTYGPGLDTGTITLGTVYNDVPISYEGWTPQNAEQTFKGLTTVRQGIVHSTNTIAVQSCIATGLEVCASYAEKVGLSINREDNLDVNPASLALGGYSKGQTTLAMASAYSSFPNSGVHKSYAFYTKVTDSSGNVILQNDTTDTQVYKAQTAYLITDVLKQVVSGGTATINISGQPVAGKTGTTDEERHAWLCGYTPYYTMAVWYGYDENTVETSAGTYTLNIGLIGGSKPGPAAMFERVMNEINADLPSGSFPDNPGGITTATIDNKSGKLATSLSSAAGSAISEMFIDGTVPTASDDAHTQVQICSVSGARPNSYCPASTITTGVFLTIPKNIYPTGITPVNANYVGSGDAGLLAPSESDVCTVHNASTAAAGNDLTLTLGNLTVSTGSVTMSAGASSTLSVNGPNNTTTSISSSNPGVVGIGQSGSSATVSALSQGSSTITVTQTVTAGGNTTTYTKSFTINVN
jgi:penicillin-binding protein 1A